MSVHKSAQPPHNNRPYLEAIRAGYTVTPAKNQILYNPMLVSTRKKILSA